MRRRSLLLAPLLLATARCISPDPAIYTLRAVPGMALGGGPVAVKVARPGLAGYLDRSEIVRDSSANRLLLRGGERWGEPLGDMIGRVLAEDLAQRLPGTSVFTAAGTISADASVTVEMDVQRFDLDPSGVVVLLAEIAVRRGQGYDPASTHSLRLTARPTADGTPELVTAMSGLVGQLADAVAGLVRQAQPLPPGRGRSSR
jgi:uncharacterized protein